jgi:tRNA A37 threonylcarbamoyladenosine modification protein TsaB
MLLALSCASTQGLWILCDSTATQLFATEAWSDAESQDVAAEMTPRLERLLANWTDGPAPHGQLKNLSKLSQISKIFLVSGPGAFTGLRVTASFASGLATALKVPIHAIPSFDLLGHPFQIPLQHQRQKNIPLAQLVEAKEEILLIEGPAEAKIQPANGALPSRGFLEEPLWPSPQELLRGVQKNLLSHEKMSLFYGLNPKISGQRV